MGVLSCVRTFASDHMKCVMRIERLWVGRLIAFVTDFRTCSSSCHQPPCHERVFPQHVCVCSHCVVIRSIVAMLAKYTMTNQVLLHLLDCAEVGGIWNGDFSTPRPKMFLPNLVVPYFCGADLGDLPPKDHRALKRLKWHKSDSKVTLVATPEVTQERDKSDSKMGSGVTFEPILGHFGVGLPESLLNHFWVTLILSGFL